MKFFSLIVFLLLYSSLTYAVDYFLRPKIDISEVLPPGHPLGLVLLQSLSWSRSEHNILKPTVLTIKDEIIKEYSLLNGNFKVDLKPLIDYSCLPYLSEINEVKKNESIGCVYSVHGQIGKEMGLVTVYKISPKIQGEEVQTISLTRAYRAKLALGFGPYQYHTAEFKNSLAPSLMLYGKLDLTSTSSLKAFDALLYEKTLFNNLGLYFSYDLAEAFDGQVNLSTLLGLQGIHYRFNKNLPTHFIGIFPQGFEVNYKNILDSGNNLSYGMFLSSKDTGYLNMWLRYGHAIFGEVNYISYKNSQGQIDMLGVSIGLPLFSFF